MKYNSSVYCHFFPLKSHKDGKIKEIKVKYGEKEAQRILQETETLVKEEIRRDADTVCKFKKEDLVLILNDTPKEGALKLEERIKKAIEMHRFFEGKKPVEVSFTFGMATYPEEAVTEEEIIAKAKEGPKKRKAAKKIILVVDDDRDNVELTRERLKASGYETLGAYNGEEALEIMKNQLPGLVIADIGMPVLDGYGLRKKMEEDRKLRSVPFIFLTGTKKEFKDRVNGLMRGAIDYILKPYDSQELLRKIRLALKRRSGNEK